MRAHSTRHLMLVLCVVLASVIPPWFSSTAAAHDVYDDSSSYISYAGFWGHGPNSFRAWNSSLSYTNTAGASALFNFSGGRISYMYTMAYNRGSANVYLDGQYVETIRAYAPEIRWSAVRTYLFNGSGSHSILIQAVGDGYIDIDGLIVDTAWASNGSYEDNSYSYIRYIGYTGNSGWTHSTAFPSASGGSLSFSRTSEDGAVFTFYGNAIAFTYTATYNRGKAAVTIDGKDVGYVDQYSETTQWKTSQIFDNLQYGFHTINITVSGQKNPASRDYYVDVDKLTTSAGNDFMTTQLRVDQSSVYSARGFQHEIWAGDLPLTFEDGTFSTAWISVNFSPGNYINGQPVTYSTQFSQVGILADKIGVRWFVYSEAGVQCLDGKPAFGNLGCRGNYGQYVAQYQYRKYDMVFVQEAGTSGYWLARVYEPNGTVRSLAKILTSRTRIYRATATTETGYIQPDPHYRADFYHFHPRYLNATTQGWSDWPASANGINNFFYTAPSNICPAWYGAILTNDPRRWFAGSVQNGVCNKNPMF